MSKMNDFIQQETITGIVPMTNKDRQYSFWDLFLSTSGFAIATWCYTHIQGQSNATTFRVFTTIQ